MSIILGLMLVLGNFTSLAAIRLAISGRIDPSTLGGIRTNATRASDAAWHAAHTAAWPWALVFNGLGMVAGVATTVLGTTVLPFLVAGGVAVACTAVGAFGQIIIGHRAAQRELDAAR